MTVGEFNIPGWAITLMVVGLISAGALQTQVLWTADDLHDHEELEAHPEASKNIVALQVTQEDILKELDENNKLQSAQTELLNNIYRELARQGSESRE